jgi:hypothetical protein
MAVTVADIRADHREFNVADHPTDAEIQNAIDRAERLLSEDELGDLYDDAVALKACQRLARSPFGRDLRLTKDERTTIYDEDLRELLEPVGRAERVSP